MLPCVKPGARSSHPWDYLGALKPALVNCHLLSGLTGVMFETCTKRQSAQVFRISAFPYGLVCQLPFIGTNECNTLEGSALLPEKDRV